MVYQGEMVRIWIALLHQEQRAALFVFCRFYGAVKEGIRTARAPRFASRGAETPRWGFLGRGLANPFGHTKKRIAMHFFNAFLL